jgi:hypothetical protein
MAGLAPTGCLENNNNSNKLRVPEVSREKSEVSWEKSEVSWEKSEVSWEKSEVSCSPLRSEVEMVPSAGWNTPP